MTLPLEAPAPDGVILPFPDTSLRSGIYEGTVVHHRSEPVDHRFSYRITMTMLDLAEVDAVCDRHPLWSVERANAVSFRRRDYLGDPAVPLDRSIRDLVEERTGLRPAGPISVLTQVRTWGWLFNPISVYFCANAEGTGIDHMVCDVQNTPWHERHPYVVGPPGQHRFAKALHVSPFLPMDLDYVVTYTAPGDRLLVRFDVLQGEERLLEATLSLRRRPLDRASMGSLVWATPAMTHRVSAGIYRQAARLRRRGAPFFTHPAKATPAATMSPGDQ